MTNASDGYAHAEHPPRGPAWPRLLPIKWMVTIAALLGVGILAAGCGGSSAAGSGSTTSSAGLAGQGVAYSRCMRSHGVSDFPDPTTLQGGGVGFQVNLNQNSPTYQAAAKACQSLMPGAVQRATVSAHQLAAELKWAQCIRSHGVPAFPDPNAQGEFDSGQYDPSSSAFQTASQACKSSQPTGAVGAVPGSGP
jgi:hypothetical protein